MAVSTCSGCGEVFSSVGTFDAHRVGGYGKTVYRKTFDGKDSKSIIGRTPSERRCLTILEMQAKGWSKNGRGWWVTNAFANTMFGRKFIDDNDNGAEQLA